MIEKILFGLASVAVFEGLILAVVPNRFKQAIEVLKGVSPLALSRIGLFLMAMGILVMSILDI